MKKELDYNLYKSPGIMFDDNGETFDLTGILCVNRKGEVFVYPRVINGRLIPGKFKKGRPNKTGHTQITVTDNTGKKRFVYIHRLVAFAWLKRESYQTDVLHSDDDPTNNNVTNLRWGTAWDNMQDRWKRNKNPKYKNRLSDEQMIDIYTMGKGRDGIKPRHIYHLFPKISQSVMHTIISGTSSRLKNYIKRNPHILTEKGLNPLKP